MILCTVRVNTNRLKLTLIKLIGKEKLFAEITNMHDCFDTTNCCPYPTHIYLVDALQYLVNTSFGRIYIRPLNRLVVFRGINQNHFSYNHPKLRELFHSQSLNFSFRAAGVYFSFYNLFFSYHSFLRNCLLRLIQSEAKPFTLASCILL